MSITAARFRGGPPGAVCWAIAVIAAWAPDTCDAELPASVVACRGITDATTRLACFDRETAVAVPPAPVTTELAPEQRFGLTPSAIASKEPARARSAELSVVAARLVELRFAGDGRAVFALENGQVWRQLALGDELLLKPGDVVRLSRGALGSYWLQAPSGRRCKVTRDE